MPTIKEISIKDPSGSGFDSRDIGAEAQNVEVSYDSNGNIIEDIHASGVVVDHTQGVPKTFKDIQTSMGGKAPTNHAASDGTYGVASTENFGHVRVGDGVNVNSGTISVAYGNSAKTACEGNDSRLSDTRNTTNKVTFNNGGSGDASGAEFNGSAAKTVSYNTIGAAPTSHASSATTYGVATTANYGHVKTSTGITNSSGTISVAYGTAAGTACQGNDSRLSNSRTPTAHAYSTTAYGAGTASSFGHVKLSDTYTSNVGAAANSIAASQTALYNVYSLIKNYWSDSAFTPASGITSDMQDILRISKWVMFRFNFKRSSAINSRTQIQIGTITNSDFLPIGAAGSAGISIIMPVGLASPISAGIDIVKNGAINFWTKDCSINANIWVDVIVLYAVN